MYMTDRGADDKGQCLTRLSYDAGHTDPFNSPWQWQVDIIVTVSSNKTYCNIINFKQIKNKLKLQKLNGLSFRNRDRRRTKTGTKY